MLPYIFAVLIAKVNATSASITFPNIQETTTSLAFHREAQETVFKVVENDMANCCKIGNDLVNYGDWGKGVEEVFAKVGQMEFRAFYATESAIIKNTGKFSIQPGGVETKYFAISLEDAHRYGHRL